MSNSSFHVPECHGELHTYKGIQAKIFCANSLVENETEGKFVYKDEYVHTCVLGD